MPTYVYECQKCAEVFEVEQRIIEDPLTTCILCGGGPVKRLIQPTAVMFKGSGFYVNDSTPSSAPAPKKEDASAPEAPKPVEAPKAEETKSESAT